MDTSKGRKSKHVEDRRRPLTEAEQAKRALGDEMADVPLGAPAPGSRQADRVLREVRAERYYKQKMGFDPTLEFFRQLFRGTYFPSDVYNKMGTFRKDANPVPDLDPNAYMEMSTLPGSEGKALNRDEGRIFTHTGPPQRHVSGGRRR